jgi:hypothetical protein
MMSESARLRNSSMSRRQALAGFVALAASPLLGAVVHATPLDTAATPDPTAPTDTTALADTTAPPALPTESTDPPAVIDSGVIDSAAAAVVLGYAAIVGVL